MTSTGSFVYCDINSCISISESFKRGPVLYHPTTFSRADSCVQMNEVMDERLVCNSFLRVICMECQTKHHEWWRACKVTIIKLHNVYHLSSWKVQTFLHDSYDQKTKCCWISLPPTPLPQMGLIGQDIVTEEKYTTITESSEYVILMCWHVKSRLWPLCHRESIQNVKIVMCVKHVIHNQFLEVLIFVTCIWVRNVYSSFRNFS